MDMYSKPVAGSSAVTAILRTFGTTASVYSLAHRPWMPRNFASLEARDENY